MEMAKVVKCDAKECAYNMNYACHAMAITIGHGSSQPHCDTLYQSSCRGGAPRMIAGVGACKVENCKYNESLECSAKGITVGRNSDGVDCLTFQER